MTAERAHNSTPDRPMQAVEPRHKAPRGFAAMDPRVVQEIARKGGKAAHAAGTAHQFTRDEARAAGRKGGTTCHARRRARLEETRDTPQSDDDGDDKGSP